MSSMVLKVPVKKPRPSGLRECVRIRHMSLTRQTYEYAATAIPSSCAVARTIDDVKYRVRLPITRKWSTFLCLLFHSPRTDLNFHYSNRLDRIRLSKCRSTAFRHADVINQAFLDKTTKDLHHVLDRSSRIDPRTLVQIQSLCATERLVNALHRLLQVLWTFMGDHEQTVIQTTNDTYVACRTPVCSVSSYEQRDESRTRRFNTPSLTGMSCLHTQDTARRTGTPFPNYRARGYYRRSHL